MSFEIDISLAAAEAAKHESIMNALLDHVSSPQLIGAYRIIKRSIDARHRQVKYILRLEVYRPDEPIPPVFNIREFCPLDGQRKVIIVGAGPAGLFAALRCIELGLKPIILERGKDVQQRRRDLAAIHKQHIVNPDSNYCFGEGGAGTYSDGKLYTRSTKRGDVRSILETLVQFGAAEDILVDAHPHIGTNKLPRIIASIREEIIRCGGEVHFNSRVTDLKLNGDLIDCITTQEGEDYKGDAYILATGHSARDIYELLQLRNIEIEFKPFALGVRAEHPQTIIDSVQYHCDIRPDHLPPAAYSVVQQVEGRGVYSFCMCPGGIIAPCATSQEEIVTNGWSPSKRNNPWANSGIVVPILFDDLHNYRQHGPLAGMYFQKEIERRCWISGGRTQVAPAQCLADFVENIVSKNLPDCSYQPGLASTNLHAILPEMVGYHLREGFKAFGNKIKGYYTNDAVLVATESRTSSPVRIPRDKDHLHHVRITNLYPCAEGAGYAGGIVSAAVDGEKIATVIAAKIYE